MLERNSYPFGVPCRVDTAQPDPRPPPTGGTVLSSPFDVGEAGRMAVCADRRARSFMCGRQVGGPAPRS